MDTVRPTPAPIKSPLVVCLWITERCNLKCAYCYAKPLRNHDMPLSRMLELADELIEMEVFDVTIAGGEPFLHPGALTLVDRLLIGNINLGVLSNGTQLDREMAVRLQAVVDGRENFLLQVSLDSLSPEINNLSRGMGRKVLTNLNRICNETNLRLQVATVINAYNIDNVLDIVRMYYPRVKRFHFMNLQRTQASLSRPDLFISQERSEKFWEDLESEMKHLPKDILITGLNLMRQMSRMVNNPNKCKMNSSFWCPSCTAGVTHVEITSTLDVIGCDIAKDYTIMGNLKKASLQATWSSKQAGLIRSFPFPACYYVHNSNGECLANRLPESMKRSGSEILLSCGMKPPKMLNSL